MEFEEEIVQLKLKPSKKLREYLFYNLNDCQDIPDRLLLIKMQKNENTNLFLRLSDVKWLKSYMASIQTEVCGSSSAVHFHELMEGTDVILPEPEVVPRSPELEARVQQLKSQQSSREYRAMTKSVDAVRRREPEESFSYQVKQINRQLIAVGSFILSVAAGFLFGFTGIELIVGDLDFGFRLILGVIIALIIALAEIYFLAKKLNEDGRVPEEEFQSNSPKKPHQE